MLSGGRADRLTRRRSPTGGERVPDVSLVADADGDVVGHLAVGMAAAEARAGVDTLGVAARLGRGTVGVDDALGPAGDVRVAEVLRDALAGGRVVATVADGVGAAGRRVARVHDLCRGGRAGDPPARAECVPGVAGVAPTERHMGRDVTGGVGPAHPGARVNAVLVETGLVPGTFGVDHALGFTLHVGVADIVADTATGCSASALGAVGIDSARGRVARLDNLYWRTGG